MKRPFLPVGIIGLAVIAVSLSIGPLFPKKAGTMPAGFRTPILAFEFLQTKQEAYDLFGSADTPERQALAQAMDKGNTWDNLYLVVYSSFMAALALMIRKRSGKNYYYIAAALALAVLAGDFFENRQLFQITANIGTGEFDAALAALHWFTWLKWGGIALFFLLLVPWFYKGNIYSRIVAGVAVLNFFASAGAFLSRSWINELMFKTVAVTFVLSIIYCFVYREPERK
jgi:hypothetical protein